MFKLGRESAIKRSNGPAAPFVLASAPMPRVEHRFDREAHAGDENLSESGAKWVMGDARFGMELAADAVSLILADDAISTTPCEGGDGAANFINGRVGADGLNADVQGFQGGLDEGAGLLATFTNEKCFAGVAMKAIDDSRHIDVDDVSVAEDGFIGHAVTDDIVDARADRVGVGCVRGAYVPEACGGVAVGAGELVSDPVEFRRGDAGDDERAKVIEEPRVELTGGAQSIAIGSEIEGGFGRLSHGELFEGGPRGTHGGLAFIGNTRRFDCYHIQCMTEVESRTLAQYAGKGNRGRTPPVWGVH